MYLEESLFLLRHTHLSYSLYSFIGCRVYRIWLAKNDFANVCNKSGRIKGLWFRAVDGLFDMDWNYSVTLSIMQKI